MTKEEKLSKLKEAIQLVIPSLTDIGKGQIFESQFYGRIVATKVTQHSTSTWSIYGFDEKDGLPRDCYYPRDLKFVGKDIMLHHVLDWIKGLRTEIHSINKYGHFHDRNWNGICSWNFKDPYLKDQNQELIDYLFDTLQTQGTDGN